MGEPSWPKAKIQKKLAVIAGERAEIEGQLTDTTTKLDVGMRDTTLVNNHDLTPGIGGLIEAEGRNRTYYRRSDTLSGWEDDTWNEWGWNDSRSFLLTVVPKGQSHSSEGRPP